MIQVQKVILPYKIHIDLPHHSSSGPVQCRIGCKLHKATTYWPSLKRSFNWDFLKLVCQISHMIALKPTERNLSVFVLLSIWYFTMQSNEFRARGGMVGKQNGGRGVKGLISTIQSQLVCRAIQKTTCSRWKYARRRPIFCSAINYLANCLLP